MAGDLASTLDRLRPALKERWVARLRRAPAAPPGAGLMTPEMLVYLVDCTIDRLMAHVGGTPPRRRRDQPARFNPARADRQCGLHLLLTYYLAGAQALRSTLPANLGPGRQEILRCFTRLARVEMAALCDICDHRGGSLCQLRPHPE